MNTKLKQLAEFCGIQTTYQNAAGKSVTAQEEILIQLLHEMGIKITASDQAVKLLYQLKKNKNSQILEPVIVGSEKRKTTILLQLKKNESIATVSCYNEAGTPARINFAANKITIPALEYGYYQLELTLSTQIKHHALLLIKPKQFYLDNNAHTAVFTPLYSLYSKHTIGCGDLTALEHFANWLSNYDINIIATLPFFASIHNKENTPGPYSPMSRLFWDELYLDVAKTGYFDPKEYQKIIERINNSEWIDYQATFVLKQTILMRQAEDFFNSNKDKKDFESYLKAKPEVKKYALFRAGKDKSKYNYYLFTQWQCDKQLTELKNSLNLRGQLLYLDLPIGTDRKGYDVEQYSENFILNVSIGAPPDPGFPEGQNWSMPPLNPHTLRENRYHYFIEMIRFIMHYVDILRIDHVMALERLYWIPNNHLPSEGAYVNYPIDELYAILSIESHRNKVVIVGENLGTVSKKTQTAMKRNQMLKMHILQYSLDSSESIAPKSSSFLAALNTHDMPPFAAYCQALDVQSDKDKLHTRQKHIDRLKKINTKKKAMKLLIC